MPELSEDRWWMKEQTEQAPAITPLFPWVRGFPAFLFASRCNKAYVIPPTKGGNVLAGIWIFVGGSKSSARTGHSFQSVGRSVHYFPPIQSRTGVASSPSSSSVALKLHNTRRQRLKGERERDRLRATKIPTVQFFRSIEEKRRKTIIPPALQRAPRRLG